MATVASIRADLIGSSAVFRSEMVAGARQANQSLLSIRAETKATADSILAMNRAAAGFIGFHAVKEGVRQLVDAQLQMQSIHYTLLAATGSAQHAGQALAFVQERAHTLGLDLGPTAEGFAKLSASASALGVSMTDQMSLFDAYAKASTTLHLSSEKSTSALLALEQMMGKGKIQAQELRLQLGQAIPGAAARFQAAVMEMVKGTDLAGKSFDQLMQAGDLTTTRFLPALVSALQESGRGWEEASHGMNAELNRLSSNWLQLKADVSGGLFNDVATGSVRLMADNLEHLADVAGVTGGILVGRLAGKGLQSAFGAVADIRASTAAILAEAQATAVSTAASVANAEQRVVASAIRNRALQDVKRFAAAQMAAAGTQNEVTVATANYTRAATAAAKANAAYQASVVGLTRAQAANIAAQEGQAVAAASSSLGKATKGLGSLAMGLVGGPWGLAATAIGALGYSIYSAAKRTEAANQAFKDQIKSLQELRPHIVDVSAAYKTLGSSMTASSFLQEWKAASDQLGETETKIAAIKAELAQIAQNHANPSYYVGQGAGFDNDEKRIAGLKASLDQLQTSIAPSKAQFLAMSTTLREQLGPAFDDIKAKAEKVNDQDFAKFVASLDDATRKAISNADQLRTAFAQGFGSLQTMADSYQKQAEDYNKNNAQKAYNEVRRRAMAIYQTDAPDAAKKASVDALVKEGAAAIRAAAAYDALTKKQKPAADQSKRWQQQADSLNQSLQQTRNELLEQLDSTAKLTPTQKTLTAIVGGTNDAYNHASTALKAKMLAEAQDNVELAKKVALQQQATKDAQAYAVVQDNLARIAQQSVREHQDSLAGIGQGSKATADQQGMTALRRQYEDLMASAGKSLRGGHISQAEYDKEVVAYKAALDQMLRDTEDFYAERDTLQADWKNGAVKAMEDWSDAAANNADLAAGVITNAASSMTDAFVEFAATGKLSFKDFADSLIRDLARIAYQKAIAGLFDMAMGAMGYDSTGGAGASTYNAMGGVTHVDFGGGRASGGPTSGGSIYEVAEGGRPELYQSGGRTYLLSGSDGQVTPARSGGAAAASSGAMAGDIEVVINITNNGQAVQATQTGQKMDGKKMLIDLALDAVAGDVAKGGRVGQAMQQRYGLQRRGVPVSG